MANSGAFRRDVVSETAGAPNPHYPEVPVAGAAQSGAFGPLPPDVATPMAPPVATAPVLAAQPATAVPAAHPTPPATEAPTSQRPSGSDAPAAQPPIEEDAWYDLEQADQMRWCMQQLKVLKEQFGGKGKLKRDDDDLTLETEVYDRTVRLSVDGTTGWTYLELSCTHELGSVDLRFEEGKRPGVEVDDEWEDESDVVHLLAPGVYVEDEQAEVDRMVALVGRLSRDAQRAMFLALQKKVVDDLCVRDDEVRCGFDDPLYRLADPKGVLDRALKVLYAVAVSFERAG